MYDLDSMYHPDPEINLAIEEESMESERIDLEAGYAPRRWRCPDCKAEHSRGHFMSIGVHRCLRCGYCGPKGLMFT